MKLMISLSFENKLPEASIFHTELKLHAKNTLIKTVTKIFTSETAII